jgi:hypothetical protein
LRGGCESRPSALSRNPQNQRLGPPNAATRAWSARPPMRQAHTRLCLLLKSVVIEEIQGPGDAVFVHALNVSGGEWLAAVFVGDDLVDQLLQ